MRETENGSRESRHARGRRSSARSLALPFLEEKYSSYIQVRFKDKVFSGTVFNFLFTGEFNFKILNEFFFRSLLYTGPVPVYNYSKRQIVGAKDSKLAEKNGSKKRTERRALTKTVGSKWPRPFWLLIGARKHFSGALLPVLYCSSARYDFPSPPLCDQRCSILTTTSLLPP